LCKTCENYSVYCTCVKKPLVIGLLGKAGSGKSTSAKHIRDKYGATVVSFAGPLKNLAKHVFGFSDAQLYGSAKDKETVDPRYGISPRTVMQRLGEGARLYIGSDVWFNALKKVVTETYSSNNSSSVFVIDDVRYINECERIKANKDWDSCILKLVCTDSRSSADGTHPSEAEVDSVPSSLLTTTITSFISYDSVDLLKKIDMVVPALGAKCV